MHVAHQRDASSGCRAESATASLLFKFVEVLAAQGRFLAALSILRARGRAQQASADPEAALQEALTALSIRLQCGILTEAYIEVGSPQHTLC